MDESTPSTRQRRVVFVSCVTDRWVLEVGRTVELAADRLGVEFYYLGLGANDLISDSCYIDTGDLRFEITREDIGNAELIGTRDIGPWIEREIEFLIRKGRLTAVDRSDVGLRFQKWFIEALLVLKLLNPDLVLVWNGSFSTRAAYFLAANQAEYPVVFVEKGVLPESFYLDPRGINAASTLSSMTDIPEACDLDLEKWASLMDSIEGSGRSAWDQPERGELGFLRTKLGISTEKTVVLFPGQVDHDSNIINSSPHFRDSAEALSWIVDGLVGRRHFVLAKPHPKGQLQASDFQRILGEAGRAVSDLNILDAIALSDCVVSINSSVAFEAAVRGKPLLLLGDGVLSNKPFAAGYRPGDSFGSRMDEVISRYELHRAELHRKAIDLAVYLMTSYYAYRLDIDSTAKLLEAHLRVEMPRGHSMLTRAELVPMLRPIDDIEIDRRFTGRELLRIALRKIKRKL
jgi:hypothetical protein